MFIGREKELSALNRLYSSDKFEFAVIYGRRRVGKTALISEFIKDKKAIYFMGVESNEKQNLENMSRSIIEYANGIEADTTFLYFQAAIEYVFALAENERLIMVIDEYPYLARSSKSLSSTLQMVIDKNKDNSKLMLILCGSSMSYMEDHVLAYKAPLYGRRTAQMKLKPFDFEETCRYFKNMSAEDKALMYGIVGGTPQYLLQMNDKMSIEENVKNTFLDPVSFLFEEPSNLLKQKVREPAVYTAVITAIAEGATRMAEISTKVGEETSVCSGYLKSLINLGIVRKETPYGEKSSRKSIYNIEDNMFRFWYRFVLHNNSIIARGAADLAYKRIEPHLSEYMGKVFEDICMQYLWKLALQGKCPIEFQDLGRWWGRQAPTGNTRSKVDEDSDSVPAPKINTHGSRRKDIKMFIMGEQDKNTALFAECKWTNENVDVGVLDLLIKRSHIFSYSNVHYYLFSKSGFTQGCIEKANALENVTTVEYKDILLEYGV